MTPRKFANETFHAQSFLCLISRIIYTGYKREIVQEDLWELDKSELSGYLTKKFESNWMKKAQSYIKRKRESTGQEEVNGKANKTTYRSSDGQNEEQVNLRDDVSAHFFPKLTILTRS